MNPDSLEPQQQQQFTYQARISKKVVLQQRDDFETAQQTTILFYYDATEREVDFARSMNEFFMNEYNNLKECQVFYYDQNTKYFTFLGIYPFEKQVTIKYQDFQSDTIHIKYHPITYEDEEPELKQKKPRMKERSIKDVLELVGEWRAIRNAKKITLEAASQQIGLSKKTLDDYYQQIKLAETYQFDFQNHMNDGIGILRKFVKEKHEKKKFLELKILKKYANVKQKKEYNDSSEEPSEEQEEDQEE